MYGIKEAGQVYQFCRIERTSSGTEKRSQRRFVSYVDLVRRNGCAPMQQIAAPHPPTRCPPLVLKLTAAPILPVTHARDAVYQYLTAVFELVSWWAQEGRAVNRANRALHQRGYSSVRQPEPFAAIILCTADRDKFDDRTKRKWWRVLRYAAEFKDLE